MLSLTNFTSFTIRIGEINYGGHMGNDKTLLLFQDARIRFLEMLGYSEKSLGDNVGIIMTEAHVYYQKEIFLHDVLLASIEVSEITTASFILNYKFIRENDQKEVINGSTKILAFDYERGRVSRLPEEFVNKMK